MIDKNMKTYISFLSLHSPSRSMSFKTLKKIYIPMNNFCACLEYIFFYVGNINGLYFRVDYIPHKYNNLPKAFL